MGHLTIGKFNRQMSEIDACGVSDQTSPSPTLFYGCEVQKCS